MDSIRFQTIFDRASIGMVILGARGEVLLSNPAFKKMLGYGADEEPGSLAVMNSEDQGEAQAFGALLRGERDRYETERRYVRRDGATCQGRLTATLLEREAERAVVLGVVEDVSRLREVEEALVESEERFRSLMDNAADAFFIHDFEGRIVDVNRRACESLGYTKEELLRLNVTDIETKFDPEGTAGKWRRIIPGEPITFQGIHRRKDGSTFPAEVRVGRLDVGGRRLVFGLARDITERKQIEEALRESEQRFRQIFENSADAFFVHDDEGRILDCNREACRSLGYTREELLSLTIRDFVVDVISDEERRIREERTPWQRVLSTEPGETSNRHQNEHRRRDGSVFPVEVVLSPIEYGGRRMIFATARDVTARKALEDQLVHQAFHDSLTGLPNRTLFMDRLQHALARQERRDGMISLLFVDLDDFKQVNDSWGHEVGDRVLIEVGRRLDTCVRSGDTVARLGGDEFTVLLEHAATPRDAVTVVRRLEEELRAPVEIDGRRISITASIGVASAIDRVDERNLLDLADRAMYRAKRAGKNRHEVHNPDISADE